MNAENSSGEKRAPAPGQIALVTVAGKTHINRDYTKRCVESWKKIERVEKPWYLVSDGLRDQDVDLAHRLGFRVFDRQPAEIRKALSDKPALRHMRAALPTWRHIIDALVLCRDAERVLLIDTDVLIVEPIAFDDDQPDFVYNCDDIPGYRGHFLLPLFEPMVPAINPGFLLINPRAVDLAELEILVERYFVHSKRYWWTRQAALSVIVARSNRRAIFEGYDVRVLSGNRKRTREEIICNKWKYWGDNRPITSAEAMRDLMDGAAVVHLAGRGKEWLWLAEKYARTQGPPRLLKTLPARRANLAERILIALRMFAVQIGRRRVVPRYVFGQAMGRRPAKSES